MDLPASEKKFNPTWLNLERKKKDLARVSFSSVKNRVCHLFHHETKSKSRDEEE